MTADQIIDWLARSPGSQREKLATVRARYVAIVRDLDDDEHQRVVRELKKRINSKKLVAELGALLGELARDRVPRPRVRVAIPEDDLPIVSGDRRTQLEAAIAADPDAQAPYLPYADWLESEGDAFGPLIAIDRELAKNPGHKAMKLERNDYLSLHRHALLGALVDADPSMGTWMISRNTYRGVSEVEWHMGFIRRCRVASAWRDDWTLEHILRQLLDEPGPGRFVQHLRIAHEPKRETAAAAVLAARPRPALRSLELDWQHVEGLAAVWTAMPELRELRVPVELCDPAALSAAAAALPRLAQLSLTPGELDRERMRALASSTWPSLEVLDIETNFEQIGEPFRPADVAPLLDGVHAPRLARFALRGAGDGDELCEYVAASVQFHRLTALDLRRGTIGERGARALLEHRDTLSRIELALDENYVPAPLRDALHAAAKSATFAAQRDDGGDPARRFVAVYE